MNFKLNYIGYNYSENNSFIINRPNGSGDYLFLFFSTPVNILLQDQMVLTKPNAIIIFSPDFPQYYSNTTDGFVNDWFQIMNDSFENFAHSLGLPFNQIFYIEQDQFIREFIHNLELEYKMKEMAYEEIIDAQLSAFFITLARAYHLQDSYHINPYLANMKEEFRLLRSQILTNYQKPWTLEEMAKISKMSRSRFCVLYKEFFGISPKEDLLMERFNMAKHLLLTTQLSIQEISVKVGYTNYYHFNKQFKKTFSLPPGRFRQ
jgi:AraC-type DNA-binding domain-containing proteins